MPEPEQGIEPGDDARSLNPGSRGVLGRIVLACGAITAGAGVLILVGWEIGSDALTAMGTGYFPAPNTALLFVLLGSVVLVREAWPASRVIHRIATAAAVFSAVVGSVTLIGFVIGLNIDDWLFSTTRMLGVVRMGHMSAVTAFCFVLAGGSLLLLECQARTWAAISGTLITLAGVVYTMGYAFGAPLLYGGTRVPVALPTSLALVALGVGLTVAAGPGTWPLNTLLGPSTRARLLRALLPTVVLLALIEDWISAVLLAHSDRNFVLAAALTAVSFLLVVGFVVSWVSRAIGDAIDRTEAELTHAAEALRASEAQFRLLAEENLAGVAIVQDGRFKYVNPARARMLGYSSEDLLGASSVLEFVAEEDRTLVEKNLRRCLSGEAQGIHYTFRGRKKDGSLAYFEAFGSRIPFEGRFAVMSTLLDITERKRAEQALHHNAKRLLDLSRRLMAVEETERRNINRELHDRVGASLSALNLNLSIVRSQLPQESLRAVGARLDDTQRLLEETTTHVRDLMADLHPPALDDYGLLAGLRAHVESLGARFAVPISVHGEAFVPRLPLEVETALFRVAQGALVNAVKHAQAKHIEIRLAASADRVALTIADDGIGFDVAHTSMAHASWGLAIMRERAEAVRAELTVESTPGKGTRVCVEISRKKR